eukprot:9648332-Alexandrium_andersonii.AAC.1
MLRRNGCAATGRKLHRVAHILALPERNCTKLRQVAPGCAGLRRVAQPQQPSCAALHRIVPIRAPAGATLCKVVPWLLST